MHKLQFVMVLIMVRHTIPKYIAWQSSLHQLFLPLVQSLPSWGLKLDVWVHQFGLPPLLLYSPNMALKAQP